ncbi:MAG: oxidoreductase [Microbacterium sp. SCN 70-27]|uniref:ferredoxin reductase family protein n=1 Tax=unclassified Microbacterium TaxID=2609290 RepID=UPI000869A818|nr:MULTISPECIES: ferredoxin reductase family protein [unclassified Microbacterium]MBN9223985.1 ferric reductase-like transmembrane domain-containing protein [Microbacterium sp.]ODT26900.1 MAG: oxidoreductase [Microbacterium sp. SCN 70-27]
MTAPARPALVLPTSRTRASPTAAAAADRRRAHRHWWRAAATTVIWLTSLFVVALWVAGAGIQSLLAGGGEMLTTLGRLTGLVSANLLLYQVLLMARVPLFERGFGRDAITRLHRVVGFWSFWLLLAHIALLIWGYAATADVNPLAQAWDFVWNYPGMLLATAATGLLIMVVATSIRRARRRRRYESWHLLHLYAYLGVGLAIPHMLWTGADFLSHPLATVYWWALWAGAAAAVIVFRIGLPLWRSWRHAIRVHDVSRDGTGAVVVRMRGRHLERLRAQGGQFFVWRFLDGPGWTRGHPFSLAADPARGELVIAARLVGDGTNRLASLRPGTRVLIEGPYGHLTGDVRSRQKLLLLGAGAGVAPLVSLLQAEPFAAGEATLLTRDHTDDDAMRMDAVAELVRDRGLIHYRLDGPRRTDASTWLPARDAGWRGEDLLRHLAPDLHAHDVFVCGPPAWMDAVRADLRRAGVSPSRIHTESFAI